MNNEEEYKKIMEILDIVTNSNKCVQAILVINLIFLAITLILFVTR